MAARTRQRVVLLVWDGAKLLPTIGWLATCVVAIPAYLAVGWTTPVVCAVFSSVMAVIATRDIWQHLTPHIHQEYALVSSSASSTAGETDAEAPSSTRAAAATINHRAAKCKLATAACFAVASVACTALFLAIDYAQIEPEKKRMPCDGACEDCADDPDCRAWVKEVEREHPATAVCPPAKNSADTDATFSCKADGYWMLVTSLINFVWLAAGSVIVRKARRDESRAPQREIEAAHL